MKANAVGREYSPVQCDAKPDQLGAFAADVRQERKTLAIHVHISRVEHPGCLSMVPD